MVWRPTMVPPLEEDPGDAPAQALRVYLGRLRALRTAGLSVQSQFVLLGTHSNGAVTHLQRANHVSAAWCSAWDAAIATFLAELLLTPLRADHQAQIFLPLSAGGLGFG